MNEHPFSLTALAEDTYFIDAAGLGGSEDLEMQQRFRERFPSAPVVFEEPHPDDTIRIFAYLEKSLPFADVMERYTTPLLFQVGDKTIAVESFGHIGTLGTGATMQVLRKTATILDYVSEYDFIIELQADTLEHDEIIIAKIASKETLQQTWADVEQRMIQKHEVGFIRMAREVSVTL